MHFERAQTPDPLAGYISLHYFLIKLLDWKADWPGMCTGI